MCRSAHNNHVNMAEHVVIVLSRQQTTCCRLRLLFPGFSMENQVSLKKTRFLGELVLEYRAH